MRRHETDVCIIGGGIAAAMLALKLSELRPGLSITVIEAGKKLFESHPQVPSSGWRSSPLPRFAGISSGAPMKGNFLPRRAGRTG